jgi:hypothetical protein
VIDAFTVDIPPEVEWLKAALATAETGGIVRVSVVIRDAGNACTYKVKALGGGDAEYVICGVAGDFTEEPAWAGTLEKVASVVSNTFSGEDVAADVAGVSNP